MIYIVVFLISTFNIYLSEYYYRKGQKTEGKVFALLCIIILSVFAGIRDINVGTDVQYYLVGQFNRTALFPNNLFEYLLYMINVEEAEPLYAILQYVGYHLFHSIHFVMLILSLITNSFAYFGLKKMSKDIEITFGWMLYCLLLFNVSLNIVRQTCAIAIVWYLVVSFSQKNIKPLKYIVLLLVAAGFHRTALLIGPILTILMYSFQTGKKIMSSVAAWVICLFPFMFRILPGIFMSISGLPTKYLVYFSNMYTDQSSILLDAVVYLMPTIILAYLYFKKRRSEKQQLGFYLMLSISTVSCCIASNLFVNRLSYYFIIFFCYTVPYTSRIISKRNMGRLVYSIAMLFWFGIMWFINIVFFGYGQTYPYIVGDWLN